MALKQRSGSILEEVQEIKKGLPAKEFSQIQKRLHVSQKSLAETIHITQRTLSRKLKANTKFNTVDSDQLVRVRRLFDLAVTTLSSNQEAQNWFSKPNIALGGVSPLKFSDTEVGGREVENVLLRIRYGVFS